MTGRRVLHVAQPVDAGVANVVHQLAVHQRANGDDVVVACPQDGPLPSRLRAAGVDVRAWDAVRAPHRGLVRERRSLAAIVRDVAPELVHLHSAKAGLVGRAVVRGRVPTVFQPHAWSYLAVDGVQARAAHLWERAALRWTARVVAVSAGEAADAPPGAAAKLTIVGNGVDVAAFDVLDAPARGAARVARRLPVDAPVVVCLGRLCEQKGQDVLLDAWLDVRHEQPDAVLVLVGDGPDRDTLDSRGVPGTVFVGRRDDPASWLGLADLVVLPSRWEGQSLALLEAMACGAAIVTTEVAGARDALGETGVVVAVGDAPALATAIRVALDDDEWRAAAGRRARERAVREHSSARTCVAIDAVYDSLLAGAR